MNHNNNKQKIISGVLAVLLLTSIISNFPIMSNVFADAPSSTITLNSPTVTANGANANVGLTWSISGAGTSGHTLQIFRCSGSVSCTPTSHVTGLTTSTTSYSDNNVAQNTIFRYQIKEVHTGTPTQSNIVTINTDLTNPIISISSPTNGATVPTAVVPVSGTASDAHSGIQFVHVQVDGGAFNLATGTSSWSFNTGSLSNGAHTITARATDNAGNTATSSITITVDTVNPSVSIDSAIDGSSNSVSNGGFSNSNTITFTFSASDSNGIASVQCDEDLGGFSSCTSPETLIGLSEGSHTFKVKAVDNAGNDASTPTFSWTVDTTAPTVAISSTTSNPTNANPIPFQVVFSEPVTGFAIGDITVAGGTKGALSGSGTTYSFSVTPSADGTISVNIAGGVAQDQAGNGNTAATQFDIVYDGTAPTTTISGAVNGNSNVVTNGGFSNSNSISVSFTANDGTGSGVASTECKLDSGSFATCISPKQYTSLTEAAHNIQLQSEDNVGNVESAVDFDFTVDLSGPTTSIITAEDGDNNTVSDSDFTSSTSLTITFDADDGTGSGVASTECKLDSGSFATCTSPKTYPGLGEGSHTIQLRSIDNVGNTGGIISFNWSIDLTAPSTSVTSATDGNSNVVTNGGFTNNDEITINFSTTDGTGSGVDFSECKLDTGAFATCTSPKTYSGLSEDSHTVMIRTTDNVGNVESTAIFTWTIDMTAPDVTISSTTPNPTNANPIPFQVVFSEPVTGFAIGDITVAGGTKGALSGSGTTYSFSVTPSGAGTITVDIAGGVAQDQAGNGNTAATQFSRTYDPTLITVPNAPTLSTTGYTGTSINLSWNTPANGGSSIINYTYAWSTDDFATNSSNTVSSSTNTATISGLSSSTSYKVRMFATNAIGKSAFSNPLTFSVASPPSTTVNFNVGTSTFIQTPQTPASAPSAPSGVTFPLGMYEFEINTNGAPSSTIIITYPSSIPAGAKFFKLNCAGTQWIDASTLTGGSVVIGSNTVTLTINDNGDMDCNPTGGIIKDPGAIGTSSGGSSTTSLSRGGGGGGSKGTAPSVSGFSYTGPTVKDGAVAFGAILNLDPNRPFTNIVPVGEASDIIIKLYDADGAATLEHAELYFLKPQQHTIVGWKDTSIVWDKFTGTKVTDPSGTLSNVSVSNAIVGKDLQLTVSMTFTKPMAKSDILLKGWDMKKNPFQQRYGESIQVVSLASGIIGQIEESPLNETPKTEMQIPSKQAKQSALESGIQHLTKLGIIKVSSKPNVQQNVVLPDWYENVAVWWQKGKIAEKDFVDGSKWLVNKQIIRVQ